jgi:hypothetical protein
MIPNIPVPVWEQIGVVIVFSFLLAGLGWSAMQAVLRISQTLSADAQKQVDVLLRSLEERRALWQQIITHLELITRFDQEILERLEHLRQKQEELAAAFHAHAQSAPSGRRRTGGPHE